MLTPTPPKTVAVQPAGSPPAGLFQAPGDPNAITRSIPGKTFRVDIYTDGRAVQVMNGSGTIGGTRQLNAQYSASQLATVAAQKGRLANHNYGHFGAQRRQAASGLYTPNQGQPLDMNDLKGRMGEHIDGSYVGGFAKFLTDSGNPDRKVSGPAGQWLQNEIQKDAVARTGTPWFQTDGARNARQLDGKLGGYTWSYPGFAKKDMPAPAVAKKEETPIDGNLENDPSAPSDQRWWQQDVVNLAAAATDKVNRYDPALQQVQYETPDYALLDPSRQVAAIQEQSARFSDLAMNTSAGSVARSNVLASSGQSAEQVSNVISQYENQNVGISNAASQNAAQVHNQQTDTNTKYLDKFVSERAIGNQNYDNAMRDKKYRVVDALNQGTTNAMKQTQLEQVMPQVRVDRNTGRMDFSGTGKDVRYDDAAGVGATSMEERTKQNLSYYQDNKAKAMAAGMKEADAHDFATGQLGLAQPKDNKSKAALMRQMQQAQTQTHYFGGEVMPAMPDYS